MLSHTPDFRQTALFSATLPDEIRRLAAKSMRDPQPVTIQREQITLDAIEERYYLVHAGEKGAALTRLFEVEEVTRAIIFVRTRVETAALASAVAALNSQGLGGRAALPTLPEVEAFLIAQVG